MDPRNKAFYVAVAAATLAAGCGRAPERPASSTQGLPTQSVTLTPPEASGAHPLDPGATVYTNEQQAENLRAQAAALGIDHLGKPVDAGLDDTRPPITYDEGISRTREYAKAFESQRHAIEKGKPKSVALPGTTPEIMPSRLKGSPVTSDVSPE